MKWMKCSSQCILFKPEKIINFPSCSFCDELSISLSWTLKKNEIQDRIELYHDVNFKMT